ncbi:endo alpha-1,4 polygalactosaminidase [Photobacterium nomapromontoriensis]|uniref:endo alpha-1,4 polygalactosaminidase n=1 Tax=Photobacterium nomapromontoriensis TaxID=2910237 RepID=UPI003D0C448D
MDYDRVVVTPSLITKKQIRTLHDAGTSVFAYLSVGEFDGEQLPTSLVNYSPVKNTNWSSHVMDLTAQPWQQYLQTQTSNIMSKGFDGLFLDTLDSYTLFAKKPLAQAHEQQALAQILTSLNNAPSQPKLIFNRGFEVLDKLTFKPHAVVAESLYHKYDPQNNTYHPVSADDRAWLRAQLDDVQKKEIEAIVIDYIPASDRAAQIQDAKQIIQDGYTPYVSDGMLYEFGVSTIVPVAKRVLGFYDGQFGGLTISQCHRMMAMPIEYLGYVPDCVDIRTTNYNNIDISRYAAAFFWLEPTSYQRTPALQPWIKTALNQLPLLFINTLPTDQAILNELGIAEAGQLSGKMSQTTGNSWTKGYYPASFSQFEKQEAWKSTKSDVIPLITITDQHNQSGSLLFKAPWGGAILAPYPIKSLANDTEAWIINPFKLIDETLALPTLPAADATTESGLRIFTSHVDGDGFPSKAWFPGKPYTAEVLYEHIFKKYALPQTVSVIEGEVGKRGLYPEQSPAMEAIARKIFALPNIEIASHTFSHPFFWDKSKTVKEKKYGDNLPIPGYTVDYDNEIIGSINYINNNLAPKNKKANLILWSGNADPKEDVLDIAEQAGLLNVNGGNTYVVSGNSSFTQVSPTIVWHPTAVQVYAPVLNENLYTNLWTEHHDGYGRSVETFNILGNPRRLKSISIYYHMYSGAYPASLKGLQKAYDWALTQKITPLYLSEYAKRARTLYETGLAKTLDGQWLITSSGIRSIRLPHSLGYPSNQNIAGWNNGPDGKYLILTQPRTVLATSTKPMTSLRLKSANGQLEKWHINDKNITWEINSHVPLKMEIAGATTCSVVSGEALKIKYTGKNTVSLKSNRSGHLVGKLHCSTR